MKLREYQKESQEEIIAHWRKKDNKRVCYCLPTGGGKTVIFVSMVHKWLSSDMFVNCLVLTDREELLHQAGSTFESFGLNPELITSKTKEADASKRLFVGMVETINNRIEKNANFLPKINLLIIDEAHTGNFKKILNNAFFKSSFVLGATATPLFTSKKDPMKNYYDSIVVGEKIPNLIENGYLCPSKVYGYSLDLDLKKNNLGEFTEKSQYEALGKKNVYDGLEKEYRRLALGKKTLIFCSNIKHTEETAVMFQDAGYNARFLHSKNKEERIDNLFWFKNTVDAILVNCGILTKGFDEPSIECVILNRATTSLALYVQMVGRGGRIFNGKKEFILLDFGGNVLDRFGFWHKGQDWEKWFNNPPEPGKKKDAPPPVKECPKCMLLLAPTTPKCPECGHLFTKKKDKITVELQLLNDIHFDNLDSLLSYQKQKKLDMKWLYKFIGDKYPMKDAVAMLVRLGIERKNKDFGVAANVYRLGRNKGGYEMGIECLEYMAKIKNKKINWVSSAVNYMKKVGIIKN